MRRREFVAVSAASCAAFWLRPGTIGERRVLSAAETRDLDAVTSLIMPSGDGPGAREAGVVEFIDASLGSWASAQKPLMRQGLADLAGRARTHGKSRFADLSGDVQRDELHRIEQSPFFQSVRFATLAGMFCNPSRGGNARQRGWQLIGFVDRHAWQPPFGYYDEEAAANG